MPKRAAPPAASDRLHKDLLAIAFITLGAFLLAALVLGGQGYGLTCAMARGMTLVLGVGAYGVPLVAFCLAAFYGLENPPVAPNRALIGIALLFVAVLAGLHLNTPPPVSEAPPLVAAQGKAAPDSETGATTELPRRPSRGLTRFGYLFEEDALLSRGGYLGAAAAFLLLAAVGPAVGYIILAGVAAASLILITKATLPLVMAWMGRAAGRGLRAASGGVDYVQRRRRQPGPRTPSSDRPRPRRRALAAPRGPVVDLDNGTGELPSRVPEPEPIPEPVAPEPEPTPEPQPEPVSTVTSASPDTDAVPSADGRPATPPHVPAVPKRSGGTAGRANTKSKQQSLLDDEALYQLPSSALLTEYPDQEETREDREVAAEAIIKLEDTLESFGIHAKVTHYERGPVLTRYEVEPERGIRVNQVARHTDDLRMALAAWDVRVEAPIPGKSAVGIEVPNKKKVTVGLRPLIECEEFANHPSPLAVALGRDIAGHPVVADLAHMPHLLIAGATNSGKSVCLHSIIVSLLMHSKPLDVQLIMVDPKRVELNLYEGIPHLMSPVVNTVQQAADVLRKAIREMEKRLDQFAKVSAANISEYNFFAAGARLAAGRQTITVEELQKRLKLDEGQAKRLMDMMEWGGVVLENDDPVEPWRVVISPEDHRTHALPRVVIIIDELADLMMQARAEFEFSLCRIAQLARATGIHLVVATQRPSVKVVTGNIKANIPSRIALSVASQVDSRTILDGVGAERLIGRGDMLYAPIDASKPRRAQGAFVSRQEIEAVAEFCRGQGEPSYSIIPEVPEEEDYSSDAEPTDELYADAVRYVVSEGEASVSMIQRRFKVGYARAGRLIDMMAQRGVVGPSQGPKPRQVLVGAGMVEAALGGATSQFALDQDDALAALPPPDPNIPQDFVSVADDE